MNYHILFYFIFKNVERMQLSSEKLSNMKSMKGRICPPLNRGNKQNNIYTFQNQDKFRWK